MKFRFVMLAAFALCLAAPSLAAAQSAPTPVQTLSLAEVEQRMAADGFRVVEIERYASVIEVKGYDRAGVCTELYLHPNTGEVLRRERDDDCDARREDRRQRRHH